MRALIVGEGQLGGAVRDQLPGSAGIGGTPWGDPAQARHHVAAAVAGFMAVPGPRCVLWCAGAGIVGSSEIALANERSILRSVLETVDRHGGIDRLFLASSAGGVYGGNLGLCNEATPPRPLSDYGRAKLLQEAMVTDWARATGTPTLIGRITNLYGPRQNLLKPQGFISHLLAAMQRQHSFVYTVPASTLRDFVYADDVGARIASWAASPTGRNSIDVKILAADQSLSLAHVAALASRVTRRPARVLFTFNPLSVQPAAVRLRSSVIVPGLPEHGNRPLEHGLWQTWQNLLRADRARR